MGSKLKSFIKTRYSPENTGRLLIAFLIFIIAYFVWGCGETVTKYYPVYREVRIPVPCGVIKPEKPPYAGDTILDNLNIMQYAKELEIALNACIGVNKTD